MNISVALLVLAWLLIGCALMYLDVRKVCRAADHEEHLDELWGSE